MDLVRTVVDKYLRVILVDLDKLWVYKEDTAESVVITSLVPCEEAIVVEFC